LYRYEVRYSDVKDVSPPGIETPVRERQPERSSGRSGTAHPGRAGASDEARQPTDLDLPGYRLHPLRGDLKGQWSVTIPGNWRILFRFEDGDAYDVDLVDYH
jgi:toxin HigB-1